MTFKVGDLVMCMHNFGPNSPKVGYMYTVKSTLTQLYDGEPFQYIGVFVPDCTYRDDVRKGLTPNWGHNYFRLIVTSGDKPSKIAYLDRIQDNFKEGV